MNMGVGRETSGVCLEVGRRMVQKERREMRINREIFLSLGPSPILGQVTVLPAHTALLGLHQSFSFSPWATSGWSEAAAAMCTGVLRKEGGLREKLEFWLLLTACWRGLSLISLVARLGPSVPRSLSPLL